MSPFKVTFRFRAPVVMDSEYPIHLDALLAWCVMDEAESMGESNPWVIADDLSELLARTGDSDGQDWCWQASRLRFTASTGRTAMNMLRKTDPVSFLEDFDKGRYMAPRGPNGTVSSVDTNSGQYRGYQMFIQYQWMEKAIAYGVGDIDLVRQLLSRLAGVGKLVRNGFGLLASMEVESCEEAVDLWRDRVLPNGMAGLPGIAYVPSLNCLRPPYWRKADRIMAMDPV